QKAIRMRAGTWGLIGLALLWSATAVRAGDVTRYVFILPDGHPAGEQVVERGSDDTTHVHMVYKNNGRGPELEETLRLAPDGTLAEYAVTGKSEFGRVVDERFTRRG